MIDVININQYGLFPDLVLALACSLSLCPFPRAVATDETLLHGGTQEHPELDIEKKYQVASAPPVNDETLLTLTLCVSSGAVRPGMPAHALVTPADCAAVSTERQSVALNSCAHTLTLVHEGSHVRTYRMTAGATAALGFLFHVEPGTTGIGVTCRPCAHSTGCDTDSRESRSDACGDSEEVACDIVPITSSSWNRPVVVHLTDGGEDKTSKYPSLSLVLGDALSAKSVILSAACDIRLHVINGAIEGNKVNILHLACVRMGPYGPCVWCSNFLRSPEFPSSA